jgi:CPA2 family monovalent cation:H+ antiporter-2
VHGAELLLELGGVILGLGILGRLAGRLGLSPIPLYLLAGLAFGKGGLLPLVTATEFIQPGAEIGVILLLLVLGMEYSAAELTSSLRRSATAGLIDLVLNFAPGLAAGLLLGWPLLAAFVLGGVTYVSSSGIAAKLLGELGRLGNRETPTVLSILVMEDLAMAAYLPILTGLLAAGTLLARVVPVVVALATVAVVLVVTLRWGPTISRLVFTPNDEVLLLVILGLTLMVAGLAERLQVSAAVGAFLVGIAISGPAAASAGPLLAPLRDLFAAVFFVFFGLQTDPAQLPQVVLPALVLAVVTALSKVAAGWWAARRAGIGLAGRLRAGTVLVARGEFSIVIAGLAVAAGVQAGLGPLATAYVLAMAVLGPLLTRAADPLAAVLRRPPRPPGDGGQASGPPATAPRTSADAASSNDGDKPVTIL